MTTLSLREAAKATGTSRSTLLRRIQAGRLSAARTDDGVYAIDHAELLTVCPRKDEAQSSKRIAGQSPEVRDLRDQFEMRLLAARLEAEVTALKIELEAEKRRLEDLREERDRWHAQAERLAAVTCAPAAGAEPVRPVERGLKFLRWSKLDPAC